MKSEEIQFELDKVWKNNCNKFNDFVNWSSTRLTINKLKLISSLLGGEKLAAILKNYTVSYKFWNHGMPDLILWN